MKHPHTSLDLPQSLDGGLIMRLATPADIEALSDFNRRIHADEDDPEQGFLVWTRNLMEGQHPTAVAADFILVEDPQANHKIVSATCLIPQVWTYAGLPLPAGQPELVGTDEAYRRRGLTRAIFAQIHALSQAYGHLVEGILGIPWFYRQFGYEYAIAFGGGRSLHKHDVPALKAEEREPYHIRPATEADIPILKRLYTQQNQGYLLTAHLDEARWRYDLSGQSRGSVNENQIFCILGEGERVIGYYMTHAFLWGESLALKGLAVKAGVPLYRVLPTVLRAVKAQGEALAAQADQKRFEKIYCALGPEHPALTALETKLGPVRQPYAWYIRVADLPAFIRHIVPVLEERLACSAMSGYSGSLNLTFYRDGLRLVFDEGKLTEAGGWQPPDSDEDRPGAGFPPLVFLQLLFGYRTLAELRYAFPDCWANEETTILLNALFPKQASWVIPFG